MISSALTKVDWNPSVHSLGNVIVHITGNCQVDTLKKVPDAVAFVVHSAKPPFNQISRTIVSKLHFASAMIPYDRRANEVEDASESVVVMHAGNSQFDWNKIPCQIVKL